MKIKITRIEKDLPLPEYQTPGAVGCDLYARKSLTIAPGAVEKIPTNIIVQIPKGYAFLVFSRSSTPFKKGLMKANGVGIIDQDFSGPGDEIQLAFYNFTDKPVTIERGERVGQGLVVPVEIAEWEEVENTKGQSRGGFGSTGETL